jgi:hypothetical protein
MKTRFDLPPCMICAHSQIKQHRLFCNANNDTIMLHKTLWALDCTKFELAVAAK